MKLSFKEFLKMSEAGTTTACVAHVPTRWPAVQEIMWKKKKKHTSEGKYGDKVDGSYESSPVLVDKDEFVGKDADKQAKDCGLAMCPHQLGVGRMVTDERTTNKRLRNQEDDLPINNSKSKK